MPIKLSRAWKCELSGKTPPKNAYGSVSAARENSVSVLFDGHGHEITMCRCAFDHGDGETLRLQFPAMLRRTQTYNSIQGMTTSTKYFISLRRGSVFAHGQLHVLLSRGRERKLVHFLVPDANIHVSVANIVDCGLLNSELEEVNIEVGDEENFELHEENGDEDEYGGDRELSDTSDFTDDDIVDLDPPDGD